MIVRVVFGLLLLAVLASCTDVPIKSAIPFQLDEREYLYDSSVWSFVGRLALANENESFSASINWKHQADRDEIELAGPFGQGRTLLVLTGDSVVIDFGDKRLQHYGDLDEFISMYTGIVVPVSALKFWVLGLVEPAAKYVEFENGFLQSGWSVQYLQMQVEGQNEMPRKIRVEKELTKLKLIISHWDI